MKVYGIEFTSRPKGSKPITCLDCMIYRDRLQAGDRYEWQSFAGFEAVLRHLGPGIAGIDLPFGQSHTFIENIGRP